MASLGANTIAILIALGSFPVSLALTRFFMYWNAKHGIIGIDVHKPNRPKVPEMVGSAVPITLILFAAIYATLGGASSIPLLAYSLVVGLAALVGAFDVLAVGIPVLQPFSGTGVRRECRSVINWRIHRRTCHSRKN